MKNLWGQKKKADWSDYRRRARWTVIRDLVFQTRIGPRMLVRVQYDYRDTDGTLFSCVAETLEACRDKRDAWIANRRQNACKR